MQKCEKIIAVGSWAKPFCSLREVQGHERDVGEQRAAQCSWDEEACLHSSCSQIATVPGHHSYRNSNRHFWKLDKVCTGEQMRMKPSAPAACFLPSEFFLLKYRSTAVIGLLYRCYPSIKDGLFYMQHPPVHRRVLLWYYILRVSCFFLCQAVIHSSIPFYSSLYWAGMDLSRC